MCESLRPAECRSVEHVPRRLLEVDDAREALTDEKHPSALPVLFGVPQHHDGDGVALAAATAAAEE
jgi:hypothetical protein